MTPRTAAHQASPSITNSRVYSNSCPLSWWCHPTISSSVVPFFSCLQSFPASGSFQMSQLLATGGQSIGVSASASVLPMNIQDWLPLGWTGLISLQPKGLSRVFSNTTVQKHQFFSVQLSLWSSCHIHTWLLEKPQLWPDGPLLANSLPSEPPGSYDNLYSILKSRDITLPVKIHVVKAMGFPVVMYRCESWTMAKKAECHKIDAFKMRFWKRLLRVPWTARRSN